MKESTSIAPAHSTELLWLRGRIFLILPKQIWAMTGFVFQSTGISRLAICLVLFFHMT